LFLTFIHIDLVYPLITRESMTKCIKSTALIALGLSLSSVSALGQDSLPTGQIIDTVKCLGNPEQSYALYLPSQYDASEQWPIIYIYDPGARGRFPVDLFHKPAEDFGYIVVASNNSRNGPWEVMFAAGNAMLDDTHQRFRIDQSRIYTSGFSGGSRAAGATAVLTKGVAGVIGCGAGFPRKASYKPGQNETFLYVGIVGDADMNYMEHKILEDQLTSLGITNRRILFEGRHQWPPPEKIHEAIMWLEFQRLKLFLEKASHAKLRASFDYFSKVAADWEILGKPDEALRVYQDLLNDFSGILELADLEKKIQILNESKEVGKILKNKKRIEKKEVKLTNQYFEALAELHITQLKTGGDSTLKDLAWWRSEIDFLKRFIQNKDRETSLLGTRLLNMLSAHFVESSPPYFESKDYEMTIVLAELWDYVNPENPWSQWTLARNHALNGDKEKALGYLEKAYELGFSRWERVTETPAFDILKGDPRYTALIERLQQKKTEG